MSTKFLNLGLILLLFELSYSQVHLVTSGFVSAGQSAETNISNDFNIGQLFSAPYDNITGSSGILQVFVQKNTSSNSLPNIEVSLSPNPTTSSIILEGDITQNLNYNIYGVKGELKSTGQILNLPYELDVSSFFSGTYILLLYSEDVSKKPIKFIKQ